LQQAAQRHLPSGLHLLAPPSLHLAEKLVVVKVDGEAGADEVLRAQTEFREETGFDLSFRGDGFPEPVNATAPAESSPGQPIVEPSSDGPGALEINTTYAAIREAFRELGVTIYKVGRRGDAIQVTFLTPVIGRRWQQELAHLADALGWPLAIDPQPQQGAVFDLVRQMVGRRIAKGPSLFVAEEKVRIRLMPGDVPTADELLGWQQAFYAETGYTLDVEVVGGSPLS
ncbi:MAG TPA: hypothetical protein VKX96_12235, partial [Chloroflexota bacterium]|nr:hypothetical protein [Chloroflexota bacterium]